VCTYQTVNVDLSGSGRGHDGWFPLSLASVYFDHPVHAMEEHTLNIDFINPELGPSKRVAVELEAASAVALAEAIVAALESVPAEITGSGRSAH
jgi:Family of unknown function (DUF6295)